MFGLIALGVTIALATGVATKAILDRTNSDYRITRNELIVGAAIITMVISPLTAFIGTKVAISSNVTFHEYWGGWETEAVEDVRTCTRDGSCRNTYQCDSYQVPDTYYTGTGKNRTRHTRMVTKWHDCPVGTEEADYVVKTTVGDVTVSRGQFTPHTRPWRAGHGLGSIAAQPPAQWVAARDRVAAGNPGPAKAVHDYDNWLLASDQTVLKRYSSAIEKYRALGLLPAPAKGLSDLYLADSTHFVGWTPTGKDLAAWQNSTNRTGAALGSDRQGDLQVVVVNSDKIADSDEYTSALMAFWQSPELGRDAFAKNGVVLLVGTNDGKTVAWAHIETGMPVGNEALEPAAGDLIGQPLDPATLIGAPTVKLAAGEVVGIVAGPDGRGALEKILWDTTTGFHRVCMTHCDGEGESGVGFDYLKSQLKPTTGQNVAIEAVMFALSAAVWIVFAFIGDTALAAPRRYINFYGRPAGYRRR